MLFSWRKILACATALFAAMVVPTTVAHAGSAPLPLICTYQVTPAGNGYHDYSITFVNGVRVLTPLSLLTTGDQIELVETSKGSTDDLGDHMLPEYPGPPDYRYAAPVTSPAGVTLMALESNSCWFLGT
jgi:hypothetical protein